jgi:hypothetical protein
LEPNQPLDVQPVVDLPNERVQPASDPKVDLLLDKLGALLENQGKAANSAPEQAKTDTFGKIMTGLMGLGSLVGLGPAIISILNYVELKTKGQNPSPPSGLTPQQQKDLTYGITQWIGLTDEQTWQKLYHFVQDDKLTYPQQILLLNFLARTRPTGGSWTWDATEKYNLIMKLAGDYNDYQMYYDVWAYTYKGRHLPFAVGAEVVGLALAQKYENA